MRVVFVGASYFGLRCLELIRQLDTVDVVGAITNTQRFTISYAPEGVVNVLYADVAEYAQAHGIPSYVMQSRMSEPALKAHVELWQPDLLLVVGWYHMVPRSLRDIAPAVGLHASLLPDYSGGAPLVWAMINGERKTGITFFFLEDGVDNGAIIGQAATEILPEDTIATLYARIETLGLKLLKEGLPAISTGTAIFVPQDESKRRIFPQRRPEDGRINWNHPSKKVHDFIRAQTRPYPGAFTFAREEKVSIWESELGEAVMDISPGVAFRAADLRIVVACGGQTSLRLKVVGDQNGDLSAESWFSQFGTGRVCLS